MSGATSAAPSSADSARMRSDWPSAIAAWCDMRANWPAPTIPTTGRPVRASTSDEGNGRSAERDRAARVDSPHIMLTTPRQPFRERIRGSWRILLKEVAAFGVVGAAAFVIDIGLFNLLHHFGWLKAKSISTVAATGFAYVGNRHWSFSHRARTGI